MYADKPLNSLELWILKKIFKKVCAQGFYHECRIIQVLSLLISSARAEFTEDNKVTLDQFLSSCWTDSISKT